MKLIVMINCIVALLFCSMSANARTRSQKAHVHGDAKANVAIDKNMLLIEFIIPMHDVAGFEHKPMSKEQKKTLHEVEESFSDPAKVLLVDANAKCVFKDNEVEVPYDDHNKHEDDKAHGHDKEHHHGDDHDGDHSDLTAKYIAECPAIEQLKSIKFLFLDSYKIKKVRTQIVKGASQSVQTVNKKQPLVKFK